MTRRVFLHLGVPKSGTTFLQSTMWEQRKALRAAGVAYGGGAGRLFRAALDVREQYGDWGRAAGDVRGTWESMCAQAQEFARETGGDTVISHELFGGATAEQAERALSHLDGLEVHLVLTLRDPARQAAAEWQEGLKHGRGKTFAEFREVVLGQQEGDAHAEQFRSVQDVVGILDRWTGPVPPERVHVIVGPQPGAPKDLLWRRFAEVVGIDPDRFPASERGANESLGIEQIQLLRRVNLALDGRLRQPGYGTTVKRLYAQKLLAPHTTERLQLPLDLYDDLTAEAQRWTERIRAGGYRVYGDLADLLPRPPEREPRHPDAADEAELTRTAIATTADLLLELEKRRLELRELRAQVKELEQTQRHLRRRARQRAREHREQEQRRLSRRVRRRLRPLVPEALRRRLR